MDDRLLEPKEYLNKKTGEKVKAGYIEIMQPVKIYCVYGADKHIETIAAWAFKNEYQEIGESEHHFLNNEDRIENGKHFFAARIDNA